MSASQAAPADIGRQQSWKAPHQPTGWTSPDGFGRNPAKPKTYLDSLDVGKVVQLLGGPGQRPVGYVAWRVVVLENGLGSRRSAAVQQLPGDHGRHCRLGGVWGRPAELFGVVSLIGSYSLCNLRDHGKNSSRKLLMAKVRHPKLIFFITWEERGTGWTDAAPGRPPAATGRHLQALKAASSKGHLFQMTSETLTNSASLIHVCWVNPAPSRPSLLVE